MTSAVEPGAKLHPAARVEHIFCFEPAPSGLINAETHTLQVVDAMGIAVNDNLHPELSRSMHLDVTEIKSVWLRIQLHGHIVFLGRLEHGFKVYRNRAALMNTSCRRMGEDINGRMFQGFENPLGHLLL